MESYQELVEAAQRLRLRAARIGISPIITQELAHISKALKEMDAQVRATSSPTGNYPKC